MGERLELLFQAGLIREGELAKPNGGRPSRVLAPGHRPLRRPGRRRGRGPRTAAAHRPHRRRRRRAPGLDAGQRRGRRRPRLGDVDRRAAARRHGPCPRRPPRRRAVGAGPRRPRARPGDLPLGDGGLGRRTTSSSSSAGGWTCRPWWRTTSTRCGYAEHLRDWRAYDDVLYVKAGTGIGSAIISSGSLFRGAKGAAGDIGHVRLRPDDGPLCRCGATGCVESLAAGLEHRARPAGGGLRRLDHPRGHGAGPGGHARRP